MSDLAHSGQRACVLPVSIIVPPQWTPGPQRTFLRVSIIQNVILFAALALKCIEIHGGLHGRVVLKAPSCPAAAALQWLCGPALLCSHKQNVSKAEIHIMWWLWWTCNCRSQSHVPTFLFTSFNSFLEKCCVLFGKEKERECLGNFFCIIPLQTVPFLFAVLAIRFMLCQKSAMHEKLPPHVSTSTCSQPDSLAVSQWAKLQSEPESCVLPSRETCLMKTNKRQI